MNKTDIFNNATRLFSRLGLQAKKHSPEILLAAGITGVVTSAVMACKATTKLNDILEESKNHIDTIHAAVERSEELSQNIIDQLDREGYDEAAGKKDLTIVYARTGWELVKLYAPSVIIGVASISSILASNGIMRKRNVALAAAYTAVDTSFKEYRGRVVERFGKELDKELRYNIRAKEIEESVVNENGEVETSKKTVNVAETGHSDYARFFDDGCKGWTKDSEYNLTFLKNQQRAANDLLTSRGYVFLNEIYDMLGINHTKAGQVVGWVYDEENPNGDNYIDFGIYDVHNEKARDFVNGYERVILLDFNVDGPILDLI